MRLNAIIIIENKIKKASTVSIFIRIVNTMITEIRMSKQKTVIFISYLEMESFY